MRGLTVLIPSKTASNFRACAGAVKQYDDRAQVLLVDDGVDPLTPLYDSIKGIKPFCFARNVNLGVVARSEDDIVILNDDAILRTKGGFSILQQAAEDHPEYGLISSTTNVTGNPEQKRLREDAPKYGLREALQSIAFIAVLVPRRTIEQVGLMDERFGGIDPRGKPIYGFCDNDYTRRVRNTGLKVGIHDACFVDHASLRSSFRGDPHAAGDTAYAGKLYREKWGDSR